MGKKRDADTDREIMRILHYFLRRLIAVARLSEGNAERKRTLTRMGSMYGQIQGWDEVFKILATEVSHKHAPRAFAAIRTLTFAHFHEENRRSEVVKVLREHVAWAEKKKKKRIKHAQFVSPAHESALLHTSRNRDVEAEAETGRSASQDLGGLQGAIADAARYAASRLYTEAAASACH